MNARQLIEAESPKAVFRQVATPENRIAGMKFHSKDEVNKGTPVLHRSTDYGFKGNVWDEKNDAYYKITGSDHFRVSSFWACPTKEFVHHRSRQVPKEESTHVGVSGVCGGVFSWDEFFDECLKPELYYPKNKYPGRAFNVPPDQRE